MILPYWKGKSEILLSNMVKVLTLESDWKRFISFISFCVCKSYLGSSMLELYAIRIWIDNGGSACFDDVRSRFHSVQFPIGDLFFTWWLVQGINKIYFPPGWWDTYTNKQNGNLKIYGRKWKMWKMFWVYITVSIPVKIFA